MVPTSLAEISFTTLKKEALRKFSSSYFNLSVFFQYLYHFKDIYFTTKQSKIKLDNLQFYYLQLYNYKIYNFRIMHFIIIQLYFQFISQNFSTKNKNCVLKLYWKSKSIWRLHRAQSTNWRMTNYMPLDFNSSLLFNRSVNGSLPRSVDSSSTVQFNPGNNSQNNSLQRSVANKRLDSSNDLNSVGVSSNEGLYLWLFTTFRPV